MIAHATKKKWQQNRCSTELWRHTWIEIELKRKRSPWKLFNLNIFSFVFTNIFTKLSLNIQSLSSSFKLIRFENNENSSHCLKKIFWNQTRTRNKQRSLVELRWILFVCKPISTLILFIVVQSNCFLKGLLIEKNYPPIVRMGWN